MMSSRLILICGLLLLANRVSGTPLMSAGPGLMKATDGRTLSVKGSNQTLMINPITMALLEKEALDLARLYIKDMASKKYNFRSDAANLEQVIAEALLARKLQYSEKKIPSPF